MPPSPGGVEIAAIVSFITSIRLEPTVKYSKSAGEFKVLAARTWKASLYHAARMSIGNGMKNRR